MKPKLIALFLLALFAYLPGCTTPQVNAAINGTNQVIDNALSPIIEHQSSDALGPYIRLGASFLRDVMYKVVDLARIFAPNAGEPVPVPSTEVAR